MSSGTEPHGDKGKMTAAGDKPANWPFQLHLNLPKSVPLLTPGISTDAESLALMEWIAVILN